jgi:hypothetical protein
METSTTPRNTLALSLDQAPPILVPLRFFLSAPLFGMLAALILLWTGPAAWSTRWSPAMLAATHLMTLGFMTMVMMGALMQMLPVLAGVPVPHARRVSAALHVLLSTGTLLLAGGLLYARSDVLRLSLPPLLLAFGLFLTVMGLCLRRTRIQGPTVGGMRLAVAALAIAVVLGMLLGTQRGWGLNIVGRHFTDLHVAWGLLGWAGLLVVGVAYQVIPMFQMTPEFPRPLTRWLGPGLFAALAIWSLSSFFTLRFTLPSFVSPLLATLPVLGYALFAVVILRLQQRRRRRLPDVTVLFWRIASVSIVTAAALWCIGPLWPAAYAGHRALLWGVLIIVGFGVSAINGMLYKIVPFLVWLHLQSGGGRGRLTNMKEIIADERAQRQWWLHCAGLCLLIAAVWRPAWFAYAGALAFGLSCLLLWLNLLAAYRMYRRLITTGP